MGRAATTPRVGAAAGDRADGKHHARRRTGGGTGYGYGYVYGNGHAYGLGRKEDESWLTRAASAVTTESRDQKGQGWLSTRASSTDLTNAEDDDEDRYPFLHDDEEGVWRRVGSAPTGPGGRGSRTGSRFISRVGSEAASRRGSLPGLTPGQMSTIGMKPDFVDRAELELIAGRKDDAEALAQYGLAEEEGNLYADDEEFDEDEIIALTRQRGFGISFIDRVVEWTLFGGNEEEGSDLPFHDDVGEDTERGDAAPAPNRGSISRSGTSYLNHNSRPTGSNGVTDEERESDRVAIEKAGEDGGWRDVKWFLNIAVKIISS